MTGSRPRLLAASALVWVTAEALLWLHATAAASVAVSVLVLVFGAFAFLRRRDEERIAADRVQLARQIDAIPFATMAFDGAARTITWNTAAERLFGWRREDVVGLPNPTLSPDMRRESEELHRRVLQGETLHNVEVTRRAHDGRTLELALFTAPFEEGHPERGFLALYDDIAERKRVERERDLAQRSYRSLVEALPLVTYVDRTDDQATNVYTSPQVEGVLGWTAQELMSNAPSFVDLLHPDDRERVLARVVHCNVNRERFVDEYRVRHRDGRYVWVRDESTIDEDAGEEPLARGFLLDLTDRKGLEEQLLQAQKMDALGQFAGGIAHDFNNLLTAIGGYADLGAAFAEADSPLSRCLDGVRSAAAEAAGLTTRLLAFSRKDVLAREAIDLNGIVTDSAELLGRLVPDDVTVRLALADALPPVAADEVQLKQVLMNLALNARDAMPDGGPVTIETAPGDEGVLLRIRDEGCGMDEETRRRALEPFFTTKQPGEGTGLGLSVVYGIVQSLGGSLRLESSPGTGTAVEVLLPVSALEPVGVEKEAPRRVGSPTGRVLVVEDREVVRRLACDALTAAGFAVDSAADGDEAIGVAERWDFDVLLTDVVMPGMSGPALAAHLRELRPALPVLFMSGYTDDVLTGDALAAPGTAFVRKPFDAVGIVRAVGALLEAQPAMAG